MGQIAFFPGRLTMLSYTQSGLMLAGVHKFAGWYSNHFSPYHLLSVETSPLLACEEAFASSYKFSPYRLQVQLIFRRSGHTSVILQSTAVSCNIDPASSICAGFIPKSMHFPMRVRTSDSHLGLRAAVAGASTSVF